MKLLLACLASLFCSVSVIAQEKPVSPEQAKLDALIGHWTIEGSKHTYLEICNRIQGNHIQCMSTSKENGKTDSSVSYLSYAAAEKMYVYYGLYSSGNSRTLKGRWESDSFYF